jgi:hypothetical protein
MNMNRYLVCGSVVGMLLVAHLARAQGGSCVNNADSAGNVCTTFTLGTPTTNCIPVLTQDGVAVPPSSGAVCPNGFFGGGGLQIQLPTDPVSRPNALVSYGCSAAVVSNTVPAFSTTPRPAGSVVNSLSCDVNYGYFIATWTGTLTYDYASVYGRHCSSGRGAHCVTGYFPTWAGGSGEIATPQPPPPPPPPPQPVVTSVPLGPSTCDATWTCFLTPTDQTVINQALFSINSSTLQVYNVDGTVDVSLLDYVNVAAANDDGTLYTVTGTGSVYDANGNVVKTVDVTVTVAVNEDSGLPSVTAGTLDVTTLPPV